MGSNQPVTGILLLDKPSGCTSHDVVALARRTLKQRSIGHAGTLDPMATGLLVLLLGDATRLAPYLQTERKRYLATVLLGIGTDSFDADGSETLRSPLPPSLLREAYVYKRTTQADLPLLAGALRAEQERIAQVPPAISALHVQGERAHARARRGEVVTLPPREVLVHALHLRGVDVVLGASEERLLVTIELLVTKGYYVRSFARDLGVHLGLPAHLTSLRRQQSGAFCVDEALSFACRDAWAASVLPLHIVLPRLLPCAELTADGAARARQGQRLAKEHFGGFPPDNTAAWFFQEDVVAIGKFEGGQGTVVRGFPEKKTKGEQSLT